MGSALGGAIVFFGLCLVLASSILISVRLYQQKPDFVMKILKYMLIGVFFVVFSGAAVIIGIRIEGRHTSTYSRSLKSVQQIWGGNIIQKPPRFYFDEPGKEKYQNKKTGKYETQRVVYNRDMGMLLQNITLNVKSNKRKKGLLVFAGYDLEFKGEYVIENLLKKGKYFHFNFDLPENAGTINDIDVNMDGKNYKGDINLADGIQWKGNLRPGEKRRFAIRYSARGTGRYRYALGEKKLQLKKLHLLLRTNFQDISIPDRAMKFKTKASHGEVTKVEWDNVNMITGQDIAVKFNIKGNYGAIAAKLFFYSPLALLLFIGLILTFNIAKQTKLHPMHYLFVMIGFFIFYLFGSYIISFLHIIPGILLSLLLSSGIMIYYTFLIKKGNDLVRSVVFGSLIFQWVFSLAFFLPEYTGFLITVAAIISFVALMKTTASIDWENKW